MKTYEEIMGAGEEAIYGLGYASPAETEALLGEISRMSTPQKQAAIKKMVQPKLATVGGANRSSRDEVLMRQDGLPADVRKAIREKRAQISDSAWYSVKPANAVSSVRMFDTSDVKTAGLRNIDKGKLEKDFWFLLTGIQLLAGIGAAPPAGTGADVAFDFVPLAISNGDFEFRANSNKNMFPKDSACSVFSNNTNNIGNGQAKGLWKLDSPKWIEPQSDILFDIRFSQASVANTFIKIVLIGQSVIGY